MGNEVDKLRVMGFDPATPGGDQTVLAVYRRPGKSRLSQLHALMLASARSSPYCRQVYREWSLWNLRVACKVRESARMRHLAKLSRYCNRATFGRDRA